MPYWATVLFISLLFGSVAAFVPRTAGYWIALLLAWMGVIVVVERIYKTH
jgi:hypothetical protein